MVYITLLVFEKTLLMFNDGGIAESTLPIPEAVNVINAFDAFEGLRF